MKLKYCLPVMLLLCMQGRLDAQNNNYKALPINSRLPDVLLSMVNYAASVAKPSDFKGKLLILDFWSTKCGACIHHFAALDSLQQLFGNKICILAVNSKATSDNSQTVQAFIKGYKQRIKGGFGFPCVVNDVALYKFFPHLGVPHYVWIDKYGKFFAVTDGDEVNAVNISLLLNDEKVAFRQKAEDINYDLMQPAYINLNNGDSTKILCRSLLTGYIDGFGHEMGYDGDAGKDQVTKLYAINMSALDLYRHAYLQNELIPDSRTAFYIPDTADFLLGDNWDSLKYTRAYSYELIMPAASYSTLQKKMQDDLYAYFKVKAGIEKLNTNCLVLSLSNLALIDTTKHEPGNTLKENVQGERVIINQPLSVLVERLNKILPMPVIDESGVKRNINLHLPEKLTDINALTAALNIQGINLTEETRMLEFFVLKAGK